jgi:hypothetical protein
MTHAPCIVHRSGNVELYFYGDLPDAERVAVEQHLPGCAACRAALDDLAVIRSALAARPVVTGPPAGDWSAFMARLEQSVVAEQAQASGPAGRRSFVQLLATAALLALVTISVLVAARSRAVPAAGAPAGEGWPEIASETQAAGAVSDGLAAVGQQHLERSKLVLLGLTNKDAEQTPSDDWHYERELASRLLTDTRLYRLAAEQRGMSTMAGVMRDLEFVLLQTSMTEGDGPAELSQIQRAIRKRDLLQKMDVVRTSSN